jgi:hypothetical protein
MANLADIVYASKLGMNAIGTIFYLKSAQYLMFN